MAASSMRLDVAKAHGVRMKIQTRASPKKNGTFNTLFVSLKDNVASWEHVTPADEGRVQAAATTLCQKVHAKQDIGYSDTRMLAGSHMLRHKLPPVTLSRSSSAPASRQDDFKILSSLKVDAQTFGPAGSRLASAVRASIGREKIAQAVNDGDMSALRIAVRGAQYGPKETKLHSDPIVKKARLVLSKYDKVLRECRDGIADRDLNRLQAAMYELDSLSEMVGPRLMEDPILKKASLWIAKWTPYRPYLFKLEQAWLKGPEDYAMYWLVVMEGKLLSPELEKIAIDDLASLRDQGVDALEKAFDRPELRYHYDVPWTRKNALLEQVRARVQDLGFDIGKLKFRLAQDTADVSSCGERADKSMIETSVVIAGSESLLDDLRRKVATRAVEGSAGEPRAGEHLAILDSAEQRRLRRNGHRKTLETSVDALEEELAFARADFLTGSDLRGSTSSLGSFTKVDVLSAAMISS